MHMIWDHKSVFGFSPKNAPSEYDPLFWSFHSIQPSKEAKALLGCWELVFHCFLIVRLVNLLNRCNSLAKEKLRNKKIIF